MTGRQKMVRLSAGLMDDEANRIAERMAEEREGRPMTGRWSDPAEARSKITLPKTRFMRDFGDKIPGA